MNTLEEKGFCIIRNFLSTNEAQECLTLVKYSINKASNDLGVTTRDYLGCTGRWATKSPITMSISLMLDDRIREYLTSVRDKHVV